MSREIDIINLLTSLPDSYLGKLAKAESAKSADSVSWNNILSKPSTFAPSAHLHDYLPLSGGTVSGTINATNLQVAGASVYTTANKPTTTDIGASPSNHNHDGTYMKQSSANGFWGITANGGTSDWVRTTSNGIIPYQSGGASSLGTSSWPFTNVYADNIYDNGTLLENKFAAVSHSHSYLPLTGGTLSGAISVSGESKFSNGTYSDPWNGYSCAIKAAGHIATTGQIRSGGDIYSAARITAEGALGAGSAGINTYGRIWQGEPASALYIYTADQAYGVGFDYEGYMRCQYDTTWSCGHPSWRWATVYARNGLSTSSDGVWKKHIKYIISEDELRDLASDYIPSGDDYIMSTFAYEGEIENTPSPVLNANSSEKVFEFTKDLYANDITLDVTTNDLYKFFKDDFQLANYRFDIDMYHNNNKRNNELNNIGFIAQDVINTKVGRLFIVEPEEDANHPNETYGYTYNLQNYTSIIAGALKAAIKEIEDLKLKIEILSK